MTRRIKIIIPVSILILALGVVGLLHTTIGKQIKARLTNGVIEEYMACGCGACGGVVDEVIYDKSEFERIKKEDQYFTADSEVCKMMGCRAVCTNYILKV